MSVCSPMFCLKNSKIWSETKEKSRIISNDTRTPEGIIFSDVFALLLSLD